jgi:Cytochrome P460
MLSKTKTVLVFTAVLLALASSRQALHSQTATPATGPAYSANGDFQLPANYRQWVYLTTGFDMSYTPGMSMGHHMFDNVFVNPSSYQAFLETGTWPDKTTLVLEQRSAQGKGSINQAGNFQSEVMGIEVHVKDEARFSGKWAFFGIDDDKTGKLFPPGAECYKCHAAHAAVDTTFVQFYPTLLPIAKSKGTLSAAYQQESSTAVNKSADAAKK